MIYIFGDSFSASYPKVSFNGETGSCWYEMLQLEKKGVGDVLNYSKKGEGSYTSMKRLYNLVETGDINKTSKLVIMLSSQYRIPFEFLRDSIFKNDTTFNKDQDFDYLIDYWFNANGLIEKNEEHIKFIEKLFSSEQIEYLNKYSDIILSTYLALKEEIDMANLKNIYFLKTFSQLRKIKIICFLCFDHGTTKYIDLEDNNLNDDYFKLHHEILWNVCLQENVNNIFTDTPTNYRPNHLSYCNHRVLANIILNFFDKSDLDEKFHKNIIENTQSGSFLYE